MDLMIESDRVSGKDEEQENKILQTKTDLLGPSQRKRPPLISTSLLTLPVPFGLIFLGPIRDFVERVTDPVIYL